MPKSRLKYRQPVEGITIPISEATYQRLRKVALANMHLIPPRAREKVDQAIGFWCEDKLREFRRLDWTVEMPKTRPAAVAITGKERHFQIGDWEYAEIERYAKERGRTAHQWIAATILFALGIAEVKARGATVEADRFG